MTVVGSFLPGHLNFDFDNPIAEESTHNLDVMNGRQLSNHEAPHTGSANRIQNIGYHSQYEVDAEHVESGLLPNPLVQLRSILQKKEMHAIETHAKCRHLTNIERFEKGTDVLLTPNAGVIWN